MSALSQFENSRLAEQASSQNCITKWKNGFIKVEAISDLISSKRTSKKTSFRFYEQIFHQNIQFTQSFN